ncbi:MAG: RNA methyltransferase [Candidatus Competibacteraceae bacterium]|nr:RNA methyltransferase [Candidatus Competibacteraceae bacterium]
MNNLHSAFLSRIQNQLGEESEAFIQSLKAASPISIRRHVRKFPSIHTWHDYPTVVWCKDGCYLSERPIFALDPLWHAGSYYVQEASSMFLDYVLRFLYPQADDLTVLDLCAAPGGKSTLIASWLDGKGMLLSNEVIKTRVGMLIENMTKWGYDNVVVSSKDPGDFAASALTFDLVVVDAPCSGEGLFRKDPNAISEWTPESAHHCAMRQQRILSAAMPCVHEGGYLIYSTCTYNPEENEKHHDLLIANGYEPVRIPVLSEWQIKSDEIGYRFYPHCVNGEGFYMSVYQKSYSTNFPNHRVRKRIFKEESSATISEYAILPSSRILIHDPRGMCRVFPVTQLDLLERLSSALGYVEPVMEAGALKGKKWVPAHALAMSTWVSDGLPTWDLSLHESLQFLSRENLPVVSTLPTGILRVKYNDVMLGWARNLGNRINNYYPQNWRLRMRR